MYGKSLNGQAMENPAVKAGFCWRRNGNLNRILRAKGLYFNCGKMRGEDNTRGGKKIFVVKSVG